MNKPARLNKKDPLTITLTPSIKLAGIIITLGLILLAFGSIDNVNYLMLGV